DRPFGELSREQQQLVLAGDGNGLRGAFAILNAAITKSEGTDLALYPSQFLSEVPCPACAGTRLNPRARAVRVCDQAIWEVTALSAAECLRHMTTLPLSARDALIGESILKEILPRLSFLNEVVLSHLPLDPRAGTLSGGEAHRIRLAAQPRSNRRPLCHILDHTTT